VPYISQITIDEIKNRVDAVSIVGEYVRLQQRGGTFWGCCPFHNEKTPSFQVNPDKKSYYCFGCNEGGGVISFIMAMDKITFPEALTLLAKKLGIEIQYENYGGAAVSKKDEELLEKKEELRSLYKRVAGSFHYLLMESGLGGAAKEYVLERGISIEMIERFRLGYAPADHHWLHQFLLSKSYSKEFLSDSGLFSKNYPQAAFFSDRLIFPINDRQGQTVAFGGRILSGDGPKYINSAESPLYRKGETLFAIDLALAEIRRTREAVLCEGYMDVIALHQAGVTNAVAPLGTAFTDEQAKLLKRWAERVELVFDSDAAGEAAAVKGVLTCRKNGLSCVLMGSDSVGDGEGGAGLKDPADILKNCGEGGLLKRVKSVITDVDYLISKSKRDVLSKLDDSQGLSKAIVFLRPFFKTIDSDVDKEVFCKKAAGTFGLEPAAVLKDLNTDETQAMVRKKAAGEDQWRTIDAGPELRLLAAVAVNCERFPHLFENLRKTVPLEELDNQDAKNIYIALEESFRLDILSIDAVLSRIGNDALRVYLTQKNAVGEFSFEPKRYVADGIRGVKKKLLLERSKKLDGDVRLAKNEGRDIRDLLFSKQQINDELSTLKGGN
jgi:DNA primase